MSSWYVIGKTLQQAELSDELTHWLNGGVHEGVRLFQEGATLNEFQRGKSSYLTVAELSKVWLVRLFCVEYELYARRLDGDAGGAWQLRIAAQEQHLPESQFPDREPLTPSELGEEIVLLLGEARGERDDDEEFILKPNRYRRARISYPLGGWRAGDCCGLVTARFQPPQGQSIVCWRELRPVELTQYTASTATHPSEREATT